MYTPIRHTLILLLVCGVVGGGALPAGAGNDRRKGTSAAPELLIPVGSRGTAMGGTPIADAGGTEALFWNPAGAVTRPGSELTFSYLDYLADITYSYLGWVSNLEDYGAIGFNLRVLSIGDIIVTTEDSPDGTGEIITPNFVTLGFTYSRQVTDRVSMGATALVINETIKQETARGAAFDLGVQYRPGVGSLQLGIVMKNIGPKLRFAGPDLEESVPIPGENPTAADKVLSLDLASFELPTFVQFGTSYDIVLDPSNRVTLSGAFRNNNFTKDEYAGGAEYTFRDRLSLRGGYVGSGQDDYLYGATFGLGLRLHFGTSEFLFDYSIADTRYFNNNQWFTLTFRF